MLEMRERLNRRHGHHKSVERIDKRVIKHDKNIRVVTWYMGSGLKSPKYDWDQGSQQRAQGSEEWDQGSQGF